MAQIGNARQATSEGKNGPAETGLTGPAATALGKRREKGMGREGRGERRRKGMGREGGKRGEGREWREGGREVVLSTNIIV